MKTNIPTRSIWFPKWAALSICAALLASAAMGQDYLILKSFSATSNNLSGFYTNASGGYPQAELAESNGVLYGTTGTGNSFGLGGIFKINTDGSGFTVLKSFAAGALNTGTSQFTNTDGENPQAKLLLSGGWLYGSAENGGTLGNGTLFKLDTNGGNFTVLHTFANGVSDGANPRGEMVESGGLLYGTATLGGSAGLGVLFRINTNGGGFTIVFNFSSASTNGSQPNGVTLSGSTLYGTTYSGGGSGWGTVFKISTNGTGFSVLKSFSAPNPPDFTGTNSDGARPFAGLVVSSAPLAIDRLYGTTTYGGTSSNGVVFGVNATGSSFTNLHNFNPLSSFGFNTGGANPRGKLALAGGRLFGVTEYGADGAGGIFSVTTDGSASDMRWIFGQNVHDGRIPVAGLTLVGSTVYGTTELGADSGNGTVFSLLLQPVPQVSIAHSGTNAVLTWITNDFTFNLQSTPTLTPPLWSTVSPASIVINGLNTVTNPVTGTAKFYRLGP